MRPIGHFACGRVVCRALIVALAATVAACSDDAAPGVVDVADTTTDAQPDSAIDTRVTALDTHDTTLDTSDTTTPLDTIDTADTLPDSAPETALDTTPETTPETVSDVAEVIDPASCPVPSMKDVYPGPFPPFPYGEWAHAEGCVATPHDVIIVLGCPSESNGAPSKCQIDRARTTEDLYEARWAKHFIVTGAAVHNSHVEADALAALLIERGIPADAIMREPLARHTDENLYYSTRIMQAQGWTSALVVSDDPGHLMMTALCDSNCCVDLGRLTLYEWAIAPDLYVKAGHYALFPAGAPNTSEECLHIGGMFMCINLADRDACKSDFQLTE